MKTHLIEVNFPFQVHANEEQAQRILAGDPRFISAILYQGADHIAVNGDVKTPLFLGAELMRDAGKLRSIPHQWAGTFLVWLGGFLCGAAAAFTITSL